VTLVSLINVAISSDFIKWKKVYVPPTFVPAILFAPPTGTTCFLVVSFSFEQRAKTVL